MFLLRLYPLVFHSSIHFPSHYGLTACERRQQWKRKGMKRMVSMLFRAKAVAFAGAGRINRRIYHQRKKKVRSCWIPFPVLFLAQCLSSGACRLLGPFVCVRMLAHPHFPLVKFPSSGCLLLLLLLCYANNVVTCCFGCGISCWTHTPTQPPKHTFRSGIYVAVVWCVAGSFQLFNAIL